MLNTIFLIVGCSGSGKTTLCDQLRTISHLTQLESYTTRRPRYAGEQGHIFVNSFHQWTEAHPDDPIVAYTFFDGNHYWATSQQVTDNDLYVIDPKGVEFFLENYNGKKKIQLIYIEATWRERFQRMRRRGDSLFMVFRRLWHDRHEFRGWREKADFVVNNHDLTESFTVLNNYINQFKSRQTVHCAKYETMACLKCGNAETDDGAIYCRCDDQTRGVY